MRLQTSQNSTHVGNVEIHELFRVSELDAGHSVQTNELKTGSNGLANHTTHRTNIPFSRESLHAVESRIAIIIPCMDEEQHILEVVLHGIPHDCLIVIVSNSKPFNFQAECSLLAEFCANAERPGIAVHQKDEDLAQAFYVAGLPEIVLEAAPCPQDQKGILRIRSGKGEAMMIGIAIAKLAGKQFVGFIDADNLVSGAVNEYCKVYAAGLHYALHYTGTVDPHAMVRIKWNSKPKVRDNELIFEKSGRSSRVVNEWMNRLLNTLVDGTNQNDIMQTANAGEHAMSLDLALELKLANGYAVEPSQLINAWQQFGQRLCTHDVEELRTAISTCRDAGDEESNTQASNSAPPSMSTSTPHSRRSSISTPSTPAETRKVHVLQIETRNPHFHDCSKGDGHIERMQAQGLSIIYNSALTPETLKEELRTYMKENLSGVVDINGEPQRMRVYPPMGQMNFEMFREVVKEKDILKVVGETGDKALF